MSSIFSTSLSGVGTHTTSFPGWPTDGSNFGVAVACARAETATSTIETVNTPRRITR